MDPGKIMHQSGKYLIKASFMWFEIGVVVLFSMITEIKLAYGVKSLCRHGLYFSTFNGLCMWGLQQWGLAANLGRATFSFGKNYVGVPIGPFSSTTHLTVI